MSHWSRISIRTSHCAADLASQLLISVGCRGSIVERDGDWTFVRGFLPLNEAPGLDSDAVQERVKIAIDYGLMHGDSCITVDEIADEDWAEGWKQYHKPIEIGTKFVVQPPWSRGDPANGRMRILIEPGMAFGTGQHATTALCLELLEHYVSIGDVVIDVGSGSGILAIAAAKLGASLVIATDTDPLCPPEVRKNCLANSVEKEVRIVQMNMLSGVRQQSDVVVANLTSFGVELLCKHVGKSLRPAGAFVASGIPTERWPAVRQTVRDASLAIERVTQREGWMAFAARLYTK